MKAMPDVVKEAARQLRKNMTLAEITLWDKLKRGQILEKQFLKQKPIFVYIENSGLPRYIIADFYCPEEKLIIEVDGNIHNVPEILILDKHKQGLLENIGYKVIRFTNNEVLNDMEDVIKKIEFELK